MRNLLLFTMCIFVMNCQSRRLTSVVSPYFDHTYTTVTSVKDYKDVANRGFSPYESVVEHPGPVSCHFLMFDPKNYPFPQYLEWCVASSIDEVKSNLKNREEPFTMTGIGFRMKKGVKRYYSSIKDNFKKEGISFLHKNFNWQENSKDHLPGWDYVYFKKPLIEDINFFAVQYGSSEEIEKKKKERKKVRRHKNTVERIAGIVLNVSSEEFKKVSRYAGPIIEENVIKNNKDFYIYNLKYFPELEEKLAIKKVKHVAVILKAQSLKIFKKIARPEYRGESRGLEFYGLQRPRISWDIIAIEEGLEH